MNPNDIIINVQVNGAGQITGLSNALRVLNANLQNNIQVTKRLDNNQKALDIALGRTSKGLDNHAKTFGQVITNQAALSNEMRRAKTDASAYRTTLASLSKNATSNASSLDSYSKSLRGIKAKALAEDLRSVTTEMKRLGKDAQFTGRSMIIGITAPILAFARTGLNAFLKYDSEMVRLNKLMNDIARTTEQAYRKMGVEASKATDAQKETASQMVAEYKKLDQALLDVSIKFGDARELIVSIAADFAELGLQAKAADFEKIGDVAKDAVVQLAELSAETEKLGDIDIGPSKDLVQAMYQQSISIMQKNALTRNKVVSSIEMEIKAIQMARGQLYMFNAIENTTALSLRDLASAFPEVSASATAFGLSMTESAALLAPMKAAGYDIGASANSIKVSLQRLNDPTIKSTKMIQDLTKVTGYDFSQANHLGLASIDALAKGFDTLSRSAQFGQEAANEFFSELFGVRQGPRMQTALQDLAFFNRTLQQTGTVENDLRGLANAALKAQGSTMPLIRTFSDIGAVARASVAQVGDQLKILDDTGNEMVHIVTQADITAAKATRKSIGDYILEQERLGKDILAQVSTQAGRAMIVELGGVATAADRAKAELDTALESSKVSYEKIKTQFKLISATLIENLKPILDKVAVAVGKLATWFRSLSPAAKQAITAIGLLVAATGPLVFAFGQARLLVSTLMNTMLKFVPGLSKLTAETLVANTALLRLKNPVVMVGSSFETAASKFSIMIAKLASGNGVIARFAERFGNLTGILKQSNQIGGGVTASAAVQSAVGSARNNLFVRNPANFGNLSAMMAQGEDIDDLLEARAADTLKQRGFSQTRAGYRHKGRFITPQKFFKAGNRALADTTYLLQEGGLQFGGEDANLEAMVNKTMGAQGYKRSRTGRLQHAPVLTKYQKYIKMPRPSRFVSADEEEGLFERQAKRVVAGRKAGLKYTDTGEAMFRNRIIRGRSEYRIAQGGMRGELEKILVMLKPALDKIKSTFIKGAKGIISGFKATFQGIGKAFSFVYKQLSAGISGLVTFFRNNWGPAVKAVKDYITKSVGQIKKALQDFTKAMKDGLKNTWTAVKNYFKPIIDSLIINFAKMYSAIKQGIKDATAYLAKGFGEFVKVLKSIPSSIKSAFVGILGALKAGFDAINKLLTQGFKKVIYYAGYSTGFLITKFKSLASAIRSGLASVGAAIVQGFKNIPYLLKYGLVKIVFNLTLFADLLRTKFGNLATVIGNNLKRVATVLITRLSQIKQAIVQGFQNFPSALKLGITRFRFYTALFADFIRTKYREIVRNFYGQLLNLQTAIMNGFNNLIPNLKAGFASLTASLKQGFRNFLFNFAGFVDLVRTKFRKLYTYLGVGFQNVQQAIADGFKNTALFFIRGFITFTNKFKDFYALLGVKYQNLQGIISNGFVRLTSALKQGYTNFLFTFGGAIDLVRTKLSKFYAALGVGFTNLKTGIVSGLNKAVVGIVTGMAGLKASIVSGFSSAIAFIKDGVNKFLFNFGLLGDLLRTKLKKVKDVLVTQFASLRKAIQEGLKTCIDALKSGAALLYRSAVAAGTAIWTGLRAAYGPIKDAFVAMGSAIWKFARHPLQSLQSTYILLRKGVVKIAAQMKLLDAVMSRPVAPLAAGIELKGFQKVVRQFKILANLGKRKIWQDANIMFPVRHLYTSVKAAQAAMANLRSGMAATGDTASIFSQATTGVKTFGLQFLKNIKFVQAFKFALLSTGIVAIVIAIAAAVKIFIDMMNKAGGAGGGPLKTLKEAWEAIKQAVMAVIKPFKDAIYTLVKMAGNGSATGGFKKIADTIKKVAEAVRDFVQKYIVPIIQTVLKAAIDFIRGIVNFVRGIIAIFKGDWKKGLGLILKALGFFLRGAFTVLKLVLKGFISTWQWVAKGVMKVIFKLADGIVTAIGTAIRWVTDTVAGIFDWIPGLDGAAKAIKGFGQDVSTFMANSMDTVGKAVDNGIDAIGNGVKDGIDSIGTGWLDDMLGGAQAKLENSDLAPKADKGKDDGSQWAEDFTDGAGSGLDNLGDEVSSAVKDALKDMQQQFVDLVLGSLKDSLSKATDDLTKALESQRDAALNVYDEQLSNLDKLQKAEESLTKEMQYQSDRRKMIKERELQVENYQRNRALAIYEGRIDDARLLTLEEVNNRRDFEENVANLEESRRKDLAQENLDALRDAIGKAREEANKFFDEQIEAFQNAAAEITKFPPQTIEEYSAQLNKLNDAAKTAAQTNGDTFQTMLDDMVTNIQDVIPNKGVPTFSNSLDQLVAVAKEKYGFESDGIGALTVAMLENIGATIGSDTYIAQEFSGLVDDLKNGVDSGFKSIVDDITVPALVNIANIFTNYNPFKVLSQAVADANQQILDNIEATVGAVGSKVGSLLGYISQAVTGLTILNAIQNGTPGGGGGGGGAGGAGGGAGSLAANQITRFYSTGPHGSGYGYSAPNKTFFVAKFNSSTGAVVYTEIGEEEVPNYIKKSLTQNLGYTGNKPKSSTNTNPRYNGGMIPKYAKGGLTMNKVNPKYSGTGFMTPGFPSTAVPAILHGGEFVVNAKAVKNVGVATLSAINDMRFKNPSFGRDVQQSSVTNNTSTINIYVDNFIGEDQWFNEMIKQYNMNVLPKKEKGAGLENRIISSYSGLSRGM